MTHDGSLCEKTIGEIGVAIAVQRLLLAGYSVAVPLVDHGYDLLAFEERGRSWRIQVKATAGTRNRVNIRCGRKSLKRYTPNDIDAIVAVHVLRGDALCVPVAGIAGRSNIGFATSAQFCDFSVLRRAKRLR